MEGDPPPEAPFSMAAGRAAAAAGGPPTAGECAAAAPSGSLSPAGGVLAGQVPSSADLQASLDTACHLWPAPCHPGQRAACPGGAQRTATPGRRAACPGGAQTSTGAAEASTGGHSGQTAK